MVQVCRKKKGSVSRRKRGGRGEERRKTGKKGEDGGEVPYVGRSTGPSYGLLQILIQNVLQKSQKGENQLN
jgi:hypothetical protein